jgi:hypothetical protein
MARTKEKEEPKEVVDSVRMAAKTFFKNNEDSLYNKDERINYFVSTGSWALDHVLGGGINPGVHRFIGYSSAGKSSEAFLVMKNLFETREKSRGVFVPAEGRWCPVRTPLRTGLKFVMHPDEWENHTVLVMETNVYDTVADFLISTVGTNRLRKPEDRENLGVFIDPLDSLLLRSDLEKGIADAYKVAGPQVITKKLWAKLAMPFIKDGHICLYSSQVTSAPKIDPYSKDPVRQGQSSGGFSIQHQADTVLEFMNRNQGDYILQNAGDKKYDEKKNPKVGHNVTVWVRKSNNEKYDVKVEYPIKYGRTGGNSIWLEREIGDYCLAYSLLIKKGSWLALEESVYNELVAVVPETPSQIQGIANFYKFLEDNKPATDLLFKKLVDGLKVEQLHTGEGDPLE